MGEGTLRARQGRPTGSGPADAGSSPQGNAGLRVAGELVEVPLSGCGFPKVCAKCGTNTGLRTRRIVLKWEPVQTSVEKVMLPLATAGHVFMVGGNWRIPFHLPLCGRCSLVWTVAGPLMLLATFGPLALAGAAFVTQPMEAGFAIPVAILVLGLALPVAVWFLLARDAEVKIAKIEANTVTLQGMCAAMRQAIESAPDPAAFALPMEPRRRNLDMSYVLGAILLLLLVFFGALVLLDPGPDRDTRMPTDLGEQ